MQAILSYLFFFLGFCFITSGLTKGTDLMPPSQRHVSHHSNWAENNEVLQQKENDATKPLKSLIVEPTAMPSSQQIPMNILMKLKEITSMDELFEKMVEPSQRYKRRGLKSADYSRRGNKKNKKITKSNLDDSSTENDYSNYRQEGYPHFDKRAFCHPRRQPVKVSQPKDATLIYLPMCIEIERCGGCCSHELFKCVPSDIKNATRRVFAMRYPRPEAEYFVIESKPRIQIERHTKCSCQCKVQPEDCSPQQIYDKQNCRCMCAQEDGYLKCKEPQVWVEKECRCRCLEYSECSTGAYFDTRKCRCRAAGDILARGKLIRLGNHN